MKSLLITGAAGFIGSNALDYFMKNKEYQATSVIDNLTYAADAKRINKYPNIRKYKLDIADASWNYLLEKEDPDVIINFAASTHVDNALLESTADEFIKSNYIGVSKIVNAIRLHKAKTEKNVLLVHISTDEVLGDIPIDSDDEYDEYRPLRPNNLYSATKAAAEQLIQAVHHTFHDFDYMILRATNNYGPNQHVEKFIPTVITSILNNKKIPIYGKGENIREWLWTGDFVNGIHAAITGHFEGNLSGQVFHFGSGMRKTNLEVVKTILKLMNESEGLIDFVDDRPGHDRKYALNCEKARKVLEWKPKQDFEKGLMKVIKDIRKRTGGS